MYTKLNSLKALLQECSVEKHRVKIVYIQPRTYTYQEAEDYKQVGIKSETVDVYKDFEVIKERPRIDQIYVLFKVRKNVCLRQMRCYKTERG